MLFMHMLMLLHIDSNTCMYANNHAITSSVHCTSKDRTSSARSTEQHFFVRGTSQLRSFLESSAQLPCMLKDVCSCTCEYIPACSQGLLLDHPTSLPSFPLTLHMQTPNWEQRPQKSPPSTGPEGTETQGTKGHQAHCQRGHRRGRTPSGCT